MSRSLATCVGVTVLLFSFIAAAQQPIIYPGEGQSSEQQSKDDGECLTWATQNTGIDPMVFPSNPPAQQTGPAIGGGQRLRGAARGAAGGALIGEIANDDAGKGAGVGAVLGTMRGGRQARHQQAQQNQQAQAQQQETLNTYHRAYGACMEGRGYTAS
jgi:hypothetical protein